jgi:hypothetical protein
MIQMDTFFGKRFCMKTLMFDENTPYSMQNAEKVSDGSCPTGTKQCGSGKKVVCIKDGVQCPVNSVSFTSSGDAGANSVPFGDAHALNWDTEGETMPLVSLKLEISTPCTYSYFFQSGLENEDNSIY